MHFTIITNKIITNPGVKYLPILSITPVSLNTKIAVKMKNIRDVTHKGVPGKTLDTKTSWVVAAVLGTAKRGPIVKMVTVPRILEKLFPTLFPRSSAAPPSLAVMITPSIGSTGSVNKNPNIAFLYSVPASTPK